ncbi:MULTISPECIES: ABC transporter substrate-binding protein [unclassified Herbaspirillum]|uniref:ABC transporter substrate-binding protein n=1 Tax=unclassified Herbaspirillum TaxID=2624150 RepID=UPI001154DCA2|nr:MULTISPECIES: ABC transporter substrate-binding protein [unclassified Herbaspirillum]MBB5392787.1 ABC-type branched-subunit amino acid transport system substrate-binding protein [Herbaspirillum sp. SJZ102]TQK04565.1 amino acid/amide ABC transporter substrate-binding protein (HAAT family) [Herbaspirillum sp. SJZ130]TQK09649.1 amino acid/amide ABC transporter substrate-binding protein (HAAT family) [Herbaspirillum sp. SJZ106]
MPGAAIHVVGIAIAALWRRPASGREAAPGRRWRILLLWLAAAACWPAQAEPGVYPNRIVIGQSIGMTGPLSSLARQCAIGAKAYFSEINAQGGIYGRKIEMVSRDDGYQADVARANTERLLNVDRVFALFGHAGWPGIDASLPAITRARVPFLFPCTGAPSLYRNVNRYVFTMRASYTREYRYLLERFGRFGVKSVALVYQNNSFGRQLLSGLEEEAAARSIALSPIEGSTEGNFPALIRRMMALRPDAVLLVNGDPAINSAVVRGMQEAGYQGRFFGASVIGVRALADALGPLSRGVIIAQVVPSPWQVSMPLVADYRKTMLGSGVSEFSFGSMEGFISARVFVEALRRAGRNPTREKLINALESINEYNFDHRGFPLNFSPNRHGGSDYVDTTVMAGDAVFVN